MNPEDVAPVITNPSTYVRVIVVSSHIANTFGAPRIGSGKLTVISCAPVLAGGNLSTPVIMSPFYKGVTVAEYQVIVVELFTCVPIKSPPAAVIIR